MKKLVLTLILAFALSVSVFADGDSHTGGGFTCTHPPMDICPGSGFSATIDEPTGDDIFSKIRRFLPDWF